ncbi:DUF2977 domain-containing protein [Cetobacterium somerae]
MKIKLNKYNYITGYSTVGDIENGIELKIKVDLNNILNYQFINGELVYNPIPEKPLGVTLEYDGTSWIETASLEEQIEYYKNLIIEKTKEIELIKLAGFGNENLELELNELKKQHLEKSHELALQIENRLKEVSL